MGLARVLGVCLAVLAVTEAFVEFEKSRIYDEKDFLNQNGVVIQFCSGGCDIYASFPDDSYGVARNIHINTGSSKTSLTDANQKEADGRKIPFTYKGAQVTIDNDNTGLASAPLLIWVVRQDAPNIDDVEIYDADDTNRAEAPAGLITIMNAEPFIVTTTTSGPMTVSAFTAGFDGLDSADKCTRVLRQEDQSNYKDVLVAVRSPLITFFYDKHVYPNTKIALRASVEKMPTFDLAKPMFVTSPGYIGCTVKEGQALEGGVRTKTYRSSLYEDDTQIFFKSDDPVSIVLSADLANEIDHSVRIEGDDGNVIVTWNVINQGSEIQATVKELAIKWMRNPHDLNQYFMVRIEQEHDLLTTTTLEPVVTDETTTVDPDESMKTTTLVPEEPLKTTTFDPQEPCKSTTFEPEEPEPEKTTTVKPVDPEPEKTTTVEPVDQEPEKTTTVQPVDPEPEKTTTVQPVDPEPEKTTTIQPVDPEPEKTTTVDPVDPEPEKTTTIQPVDPEPEKTTTVEPVDPEPEKTTTVEPVDPEPEKTSTVEPVDPEPEKTTTVQPEGPEPTKTKPPRRTTSLATTTFHPKSTVTTTYSSTAATVPTVSPTTSGAGYGSILLSIALASVLVLL